MESLGDNPALKQLRADMGQSQPAPGEAETMPAAEIIHQIESSGGDVNNIMLALQKAAAEGYLGPKDPEKGRSGGGGNLTPARDIDAGVSKEGAAIYEAVVDASSKATRGVKLPAIDGVPAGELPHDLKAGHAIVDEAEYTRLAERLASSNYSRLEVIRAGLEERGLVAAQGDAESDTPLGRALAQAEAAAERTQAVVAGGVVDPQEGDKLAAHRVEEGGRHRLRQVAEQPAVSAAEQRELDRLNRGEQTAKADRGKSGRRGKPAHPGAGKVTSARLDALESRSRPWQFDDDMSAAEQARANRPHRAVDVARAAVDAATSTGGPGGTGRSGSGESPRSESLFGSGNKFTDNPSIDIAEIIVDKRAGGKNRDQHPFDPVARAKAADQLAEDYLDIEDMKRVGKADKKAIEAEKEARDKAEKAAKIKDDQIKAYDSYADNIKATADRETHEFNWNRYEALRESDHDEALAMDPEARAQSEIWQRFHNEIADLNASFEDQIRQAEADSKPELAKTLRAERDRQVKELQGRGEAAVQAEKTRQVELAKRVAEVVDEATKHLRNGESWEKTIRAPAEALDDIGVALAFEDEAIARRQALRAEPLPYRERHYANKPGQGWSSLVESHFEAGEDNLTLVERRDRRTGRLISQQVLTSKEPVEHRRGDVIPPAELNDPVMTSRENDLSQLKDRKGNRGFWKGLRDGFRDLRSNDIWLGGPGGVYERYGATEENLADFNREKARRGGEI